MKNNKIKIGEIEAEVLEVGAVIDWSYDPCYDVDFMRKFAKIAHKYPHIIEVGDFRWVLTDNEELDGLINYEINSICKLQSEKEEFEDVEEYNDEYYKDYKFYILETENVIKN